MKICKRVIFVFFVFAISTILCGCSFDGLNGKFQTQTGSAIDISKISSYQDVVEVCKPAVVGIVSTNGKYQSIGTGVCIKNGNYILTNNHVVENSDVATLYLSTGKTTGGTVVWTDPSSDLAMIKSEKAIPYLPIAESGTYKSGDEVIAIGTPLALAFRHSATKGIISAINRTISVDNEDSGTTTLYNMIQHDASINPGNSGGPLINMKGEVVGINTVKVTDAEGMGFAIPVDTFKNVVERVSTNGSFEPTYLGVFGFDNQLKNIGSVATGVYVQDVAKNSPAYVAGIEKGDVIVMLNGSPVNLAKDLKSELYLFDVGDYVQIGYIHNGVEKTANIKLASRPNAKTKKWVLNVSTFLFANGFLTKCLRFDAKNLNRFKNLLCKP